jgi:ferredoxin-type protein NapH
MIAGKMKIKFYAKLDIYRRIVQVLSLLFLIAVPILVVNQFYVIIGNLYSITVAGVDVVDPAMSFQTILLSREFVEVLLIGIIIPVILALIFGRVFCSWVCPFNTISEYWQLLTAKIFRRKARKVKLQVPDNNPRPFIYWSVLISLFVITYILDFPLITFLSAPGIISAEISHYIMGMGLGIEIAVVFGIIFIEGILFKRYWCKYVCPVGGVLSVFRTKKTMTLVHNPVVCDCAGQSEPCGYSCPLNLSPKRKDLYPYCFNCGKCVKICEKTGSGALSFRFGTNNGKVEDKPKIYKKRQEVKSPVKE